MTTHYFCAAGKHSHLWPLPLKMPPTSFIRRRNCSLHPVTAPKPVTQEGWYRPWVQKLERQLAAQEIQADEKASRMNPSYITLAAARAMWQSTADQFETSSKEAETMGKSRRDGSDLEVLYFDPELGEARIRVAHRFQDIHRLIDGQFRFLKHFGDGHYDAGSDISITDLRSCLQQSLSDRSELALAVARFYDVPVIAVLRALAASTNRRPPADFLTPKGLATGGGSSPHKPTSVVLF